MENQRETTIGDWLANIHLSKWGKEKDYKALTFLLLIKHGAPTFRFEVLL